MAHQVTVPFYIAQASEQDRLENLFFTQGFRVSFVHYEEVAKDVGLGLDSPPEIHGRAIFIAEQLRFSDAQVMKPTLFLRHGF